MIVAVLGKELFLSCFMGIRTAFIRTLALSELLCYQSSCLTLSGLLRYQYSCFIIALALLELLLYLGSCVTMALV